MSDAPPAHAQEATGGDAPWLFAPAMPAEGGTHWLSRDEARHATGARRLRAGDAITLFDGRGSTAHATLGHARRDDGAIEVRIGAMRSEPRQGRHVIVASAIPKGDRLATLMEGIGPLGVAEFVPLRTEHGVVPWSGHLAQRCGRILVECAKQCRSPWVTALPTVEAHERDAIAAVHGGCAHGAQVLVADREGAPMAQCARSLDPARPVLVLIGPEGGFSGRERTGALAAGATPVSLGPAILRIELAATVAAALLRLG
jgi:16S rRNA (uracil1498-N3)-methyltransferase